MMLDEKSNSRHKRLGCPYYDHERQTWCVRFPDRESEEGDLLYVASEFARTGLYYPYYHKHGRDKRHSEHAHSFEGVIEALLEDPDWFSIEGFEEFYSQQEIKMLLDIQEKLMHPPFIEIIPGKEP